MSTPEVHAGKDSFIQAGQFFVERTRKQTFQLPMYFISSDTPGTKYDGSPMRIITGIDQHQETPLSSDHLDSPCLGNPIINFSDCDPTFIANLAKGVSEGRLPYNDKLKDKIVERISGVFFAGATPRMLAADVAESVDFVFKDDSAPDTYRVSAGLFFESLSNKRILAFDIHDLVHHPLQLEAWPEQFAIISRAAHVAHLDNNQHPEAKRAQKLTQMVWLATFEESLLSQDGELHSFGCLNWLSPSETPAEAIVDIRTISDDEQRIAYQWHYLDALKDMYRIQLTNSKELGDDLEWVEKLGYRMDERFIRLCKSADPRPFENMNFWDVIEFDIVAPKTPEELFANAIHLLQEEM